MPTHRSPGSRTTFAIESFALATKTRAECICNSPRLQSRPQAQVTLYGVPRSRAAFAADPRHPNTSKGNVDQQPRVRAQHRYATPQSADAIRIVSRFLAALVFGAASISPVSNAPAKIAHVLTAITRAVSPALAQCELTFVERQPIDLAKAQQQHTAYEHLLAKIGIHVH